MCVCHVAVQVVCAAATGASQFGAPRVAARAREGCVPRSVRARAHVSASVCAQLRCVPSQRRMAVGCGRSRARDTTAAPAAGAVECVRTSAAAGGGDGVVTADSSVRLARASFAARGVPQHAKLEGCAPGRGVAARCRGCGASRTRAHMCAGSPGQALLLSRTHVLDSGVLPFTAAAVGHTYADTQRGTRTCA